MSHTPLEGFRYCRNANFFIFSVLRLMVSKVVGSWWLLLSRVDVRSMIEAIWRMNMMSLGRPELRGLCSADKQTRGGESPAKIDETNHYLITRYPPVPGQSTLSLPQKLFSSDRVNYSGEDSSHV